MTSIRSVERVRKCRGQDSAEYWILLTNKTRAQAQFTGFNASVTDIDGQARGGSHWDPIKNALPIESAQFTPATTGVPSGYIHFRIRDTYEPSLADKSSTHAETPTPRR